jgi:hypothetical protein
MATNPVQGDKYKSAPAARLLGPYHGLGGPSRRFLPFTYQPVRDNRMSAMLRPGIPVARKHPYPDYLYVDVPTIVKKASALVFLVCVFSLALYFSSGVYMIHPFICLITIVGAAAFYIMGVFIEKQYI